MHFLKRIERDIGNVNFKMRKPLIWILAFLALTFVGDRFFGFLLQNMSEKSQFRYSRLYYTNEAADILFVGNSRGLTFFQPEVEKITGSKTMNLSYNGMPADLAKVLVMDYLDRHPAPKTMVVDITLCDRDNDILKTGFIQYAPQSERLSAMIKSMGLIKYDPREEIVYDEWLGRKVYYGGQISHLYRFNSEIFQRVLYYRNKTDNDWLIDRVLPNGKDDKEDMTSYKVRMFPLMVTRLKEMIDYAKTKGVEVKLVINPYYPPFAETIRDSFLTPLKTYVEAQTGMPVNDFSTALTYRDEIGDYQHANKKGSMRYMQILKSSGLFDVQNNDSLGELNRVNISPYDMLKADTLTEKTVTFYESFQSAPPSVSTAKNSVEATTKGTDKSASLPSSDNTIPVLPTHFDSPKTPKTLTEKKRTSSWVAVDTLF